MSIKPIFINHIEWGYIFRYFWSKESLFRKFQNDVLIDAAPVFTGNVVEVGGEKKYRHHTFFPFCNSFVVTNIKGDYDFYLDAVEMGVEDNSIDNIIAISVLQHIPMVHKATEQIQAKLKPGGLLLVSNAFIHPVCDTHDYWRFHIDAYKPLFKDMEILKVYNLGARYSGISNTLQRPKGNLRGRYFINKVFGFFALILSKILDGIDTAPIGYALLMKKKTNG